MRGCKPSLQSGSHKDAVQNGGGRSPGMSSCAISNFLFTDYHSWLWYRLRPIHQDSILGIEANNIHHEDGRVASRQFVLPIATATDLSELIMVATLCARPGLVMN